MASAAHTFVLKVEDGCLSWRLICPDDGKGCGPSNVCGSCGRAVDDPETAACYDCPSQADVDAQLCWAQSWVGEAAADEVIHGTVEVAFPVHCQWNGDGFEAHVIGSAVAVES
jgi:hypothetical protein